MRYGLRGGFLALLVWILYAPTLHTPFVLDDKQNIQYNVAIRLERFDRTALTRLFKASHALHRPVANFSFAVNYYIHRYNVVGYHVVNILIHITTGLLLYRFIHLTSKLSAAHLPAHLPPGIAFCTALLWLVHPLQTQAVTYIVQRMTSLAALFYLGAMVLYIQARLARATWQQVGLFASCLLTCLLAFGTKEIAAPLPVFILLYEVYFFQDLPRAWFRRFGLWGLSILGFLLLLVWMYLGARPWQALLLSYDSRDFTMLERVLTEWRVVFFYLRLLLWPHPSQLTLDHDFPLSHSLLDPFSTLLSLGGIVGLLGIAVVRARQNRILSFCILWFLGNLVLESSVIGLEILFEHRLYLPSMLLFWLFVMLLYTRLKPAWLRVGCVGVVALVWMVWTYERHHAWRDEVTLWQDCIAKAPHKSRPYLNLSWALQSQGRFDEATSYGEDALRLSATSVEVSIQLGLYFRDQQLFDAARQQFMQALSRKPTSASLHTSLGTVFAEERKFDEAIAHYMTALRYDPTFAMAHYFTGVALVRQGKFLEAWQRFNTALYYQPALALARYGKGELLLLTGKLPEAIRQYRAALSLDPTLSEAHVRLGKIFTSLGDMAAASAHYESAIRLVEEACKLSNFMNVTLLMQLLRTYEMAGQSFEAMLVAQQALTRAQAAGIPTLVRELQQWLDNTHKAP